MSDEISPERKLAFYGGSCLALAGICTVVVGLIFFVSDMNRPMPQIDTQGTPEEIVAKMRAAQETPEGFVLIWIGTALIPVGLLLRHLGARGLAGSGVILDPQQAREDLEPYSRQAGGMVKDALDEADIKLGAQPQQVVVVRCRKCSTLNSEDAKFCKECGDRV
jgi:hypothetical protein